MWLCSFVDKFQKCEIFVSWKFRSKLLAICSNQSSSFCGPWLRLFKISNFHSFKILKLQHFKFSNFRNFKNQQVGCRYVPKCSKVLILMFPKITLPRMFPYSLDTDETFWYDKIKKYGVLWFTNEDILQFGDVYI